MLRRIGKALKRALQRVQLFLMGKEFRHQVTCYERYRKTVELYSDRLHNIPEVLQTLGNLDAIVRDLKVVDLPWATGPWKHHPPMDVFQLYAVLYKLRKLRLSEACQMYSGAELVAINESLQAWGMSLDRTTLEAALDPARAADLSTYSQREQAAATAHSTAAMAKQTHIGRFGGGDRFGRR